jgi:lipopolysaccharide/colanic/teichoic acid biosynthesis glycosyltransferase
MRLFTLSPRGSLRQRIAVSRLGDRRSYFRKKAKLDRLLAAVLLIAALPVLILCWLLIRCSSRGPALFRQERVGCGGRRFVLLRFRTVNLANSIGLDQLDPTTTFAGAILRACRLDGLPQLWNVLRGEMSFVGPRPERPDIAAILEQSIPNYRRRLMVKPGITGLAQLKLSPTKDLPDVRRNGMLNIEYIGRANLLLDFSLMVHAGLRIFPFRTVLRPRFPLFAPKLGLRFKNRFPKDLPEPDRIVGNSRDRISDAGSAVPTNSR